MLDGEGEDDLTELLEAIGRQQQEAVMPSIRGHSEDVSVVEQQHLQTIDRTLNLDSSSIQSAIMLLIQSQAGQNKQNQDTMRKLLIDREDGSHQEGKREKSEVSYHPQDPVLIDENYKLLDDAHDNINTMIRQKIRPINMAPGSWWTKGSLRQLESNT